MTDTTTVLPLYFRTATELRDAMRSGDLTAVEVMTAFLDRIDATDDAVNVMVYRLPREAALALATEADRARAAGEELGPLHGMPIAIKDLVDVAGMPTSRGSRAFAGRGPMPEDAPHVAKLRAAGALIIGKTNSPEFGVGTVTFNDVFGVTRNPFDTTRHAGGSTGGVAAVAAGMLPFCDGSDSGGSLRYPASFCNAVGLRTTPGLVPAVAGGGSWSPHSVNGPVARTCRDAALLLSGMTGAEAFSPLSSGLGASKELGAVRTAPLRLAWSVDLGDLPISPDVRSSFAQTRDALETGGVEVVDIDVDFAGADRAWEVIELIGWFSLLGRDPLENPEKYRDDFARNVAEASEFSTSELIEAEARRYELFTRFVELLTEFDAFVCPGAPVVAPPADWKWVPRIEDETFDRYFLWQRLACRLTVTEHPVLAMPAGFSDGGLPIGIQVVGRYGADVELLAIGEQLELILGAADVHPDLG
ncbi:amidase [Microbacterium oryzae]|uniref:amidase n=1 Tax=Microbacterium oryzae TaxID=743009 RepID=UPI0025B11ECB|nr:amidase [Microbacterium oryzae]MDN3310177.1 amidase [Microbacterium oryzae]